MLLMGILLYVVVCHACRVSVTLCRGKFSLSCVNHRIELLERFLMKCHRAVFS